ncbi:MAG: hypothetical protein COY82_00950, partial [Parcubacteria group bacterium CG_4_10_14_0_8_um_filter_35_7]
PDSPSDDIFYYEYNDTSGNTISGDESNISDLYIDNITISEGTSYFHTRGKNGVGIWGNEKTFIVKYDKTNPIISITSISESSDYLYTIGSTIYTKNNVATPGSFTINVSSSDTGGSGVAGVAGETAFGDTPTDSEAPYELTYSVEQGATSDGIITITSTDNAGNINTANVTHINDIAAPSGGSISYIDGYYTAASVDITYSLGLDSGSGVNSSTGKIQRREAAFSGETCGVWGEWQDLVTDSDGSYTDATIAGGNCYQYQYQIKDNVSNQATYTSSNILTVVGILHHFEVDAPDSANVGTNFPITITAKDSNENTSTLISGDITLSAAPGTISPNSIAEEEFTDDGIWQGNVSLNEIGIVTITAQNGVILGSDTVNVSAGPLDHFEVNAPDKGYRDFGFPLTITALDAYENPTSQVTGDTTLTLTLGAITPNVIHDTEWTNGVWTSNNVTLDTQGTITITASNGPAQGSDIIDILYVDHFGIELTGLGPFIVGTPFEIKITAYDKDNNVILIPLSNDVDLSVSSGSINPTSILAGNFSAGVWTGDITLDTVGKIRITVTDSTDSDISGNYDITISPGALDHFEVTANPTNLQAGNKTVISIMAKDSLNNTITNYQNIQNINLTQTGGTGVAIIWSGNGVTDNGNGTGVLAGGKFVSGKAVVYLKNTIAEGPVTATVTENDTGFNKTGTSPEITWIVGCLHHLTITGYPAGSITAGVSFTSNIIVTAYDTNNNVKTDYDGTVTFSSTDLYPADIPSNYTFNGGDSGVHTFPDSQFTLYTAPSQTITVKDIATNISTFCTVQVAPNAASALIKVSGDSQTRTVNTILANPFVIKVKDQYGNGVSGVNITFTITNYPLGTTGQILSQASVQTDNNGLAQTYLTLGNQNGTYETKAECSVGSVIFEAEATGGIPPAQPAGLQYTAATVTSITWNWNDVTAATGYKVYDSSDDSLLKTIDSATSIWEQDSLSSNTQYSIYVRATNANGEGIASSSVLVYTLTPSPTNLQATPSTTTMDLTVDA